MATRAPPLSGVTIGDHMSSPAASLTSGEPRTRVGDDLARLRGLRIAHLIETNGPGGAERMLVHLASELQAAGCHNLVIVPEGGEGWLPQQLAGTGVTVETFRLDRPLSPAFARRLTSLLRHHRITLAHSHEFTMAVYGAWASRRAGIPHVVTMHGSRYKAPAESRARA